MPRTEQESASGRAVRGAAVIVASQPSEAGGRKILPALQKAGQMTFIEQVIVRFQHMGTAPIIVVTGYDNDELERHLAKMSVISLHRPGWQAGNLYEDALFGLTYAERTCAACEKIWLAVPQIPFVKNDTLAALLNADSAAALPVYEDREGLPLIFQRRAIAALAEAPGGKTLADLVHAADSLARIPVDDTGVLPAAGVNPKGSRLPMRPRLKLTLARDGFFFGPGPATLLRLIDETRSVRTACTRMKLSYSKGWQLLNSMEEELGIQVIERRPGGLEGGGSSLTEAGRDLLNRYEQLVSESQREVNRLFDEIFGFYSDSKPL